MPCDFTTLICNHVALHRAAIEKNSFAVLVRDLDEAIDVANRLAPEHLEVHTEGAAGLVGRFEHYGALFVGHNAAEVLGDYGAGPNHTLPTGGTARSYGGLCVRTFLRVRTWLRIDDLKVSWKIPLCRLSLPGRSLTTLFSPHGRRRLAA
jgi:histidinol dehydrogenase